MKSIFSVLTVLLLACSLTACEKQEVATPVPSEQAAPATAVEQESSPAEEEKAEAEEEKAEEEETEAVPAEQK